MLEAPFDRVISSLVNAFRSPFHPTSRNGNLQEATERTEGEEFTTSKWNFFVHSRGEWRFFRETLILYFLHSLLLAICLFSESTAILAW